MKKYEKYKDSGVEWIGEIPEHWQTTRLKNCGSLYSGLSGKSGNDFEKHPKDNYKPFINFTNIANNRYIVNDNFGYVLITEGENQNRVSKWDLFFLMSSENQEDVGKSALLKEDYEELYLNSFCKGFRVNKEGVNSMFLNYLLSSSALSQLISLEGRGFTRINLRMEGVNNLPIILPTSIEEQTAIANYLDHKTAQIDNLIAKKEKLIELLKEERSAMINQAVTKGLDPNVPMKDSGIEWLGEIPEGWEVKRLKDILHFGTGLSITKQNLKDEGVPCVNYGEIHSKYGVYLDTEIHKLRCVEGKYLEEFPKAIIRKGDFVFADTSEDVEGSGNFTHLRSNDNIFAGYHTVTAKPKVKINSWFFAFEFDSLDFRTQIRQSIKGIKVYSVTQSILKNTKVWVPPIEEQTQIANYIDHKTAQIDDLIATDHKQIELLKEYKIALISEVVTGKIDVRDEKIN